MKKKIEKNIRNNWVNLSLIRMKLYMGSNSNGMVQMWVTWKRDNIPNTRYKIFLEFNADYHVRQSEKYQLFECHTLKS